VPWALGIDLGGTKIHAELLDQHGGTAWQLRTATPAGDYAGTLHKLAALVQAARQAAQGQAMSIGVGTPGALAANGLLKNANSTCLNGQALQQDLEAAFGQPVQLANDANCLALSEATDGAGAGHEVVFTVILGTGTGAGIAVRGQVLGGPHRLAGEWGHNPLPWALAEETPGPPCWCGKTGCMEAWVSGPALALDHRARTGQPLDAEAIAAQAAQGDVQAQATLERHAQRLARGLASVINLLDPDVIVLAGGLSQMPHLYQRVPQLWSRWIFSGGVADPIRTLLLPAQHGDASGVRGAAWLGRSGGHPPASAAHRPHPPFIT
jgi:fructokinase